MHIEYNIGIIITSQSSKKLRTFFNHGVRNLSLIKLSKLQESCTILNTYIALSGYFLWATPKFWWYIALSFQRGDKDKKSGKHQQLHPAVVW